MSAASAALVAAAPVFADGSHGLRLPAWIEPATAASVAPAAYLAAPQPNPEGDDFGELLAKPPAEKAIAPPAEPAGPLLAPAAGPPPREPRELTEPVAVEVRRLEHVANGAQTTHALTRLVARYLAVRERVLAEAGEDAALRARVDRVGGWAYESLGRLHAASGDNARAVDDFRAAVSADPGSAAARHALAIALAESGRTAEALDELSRLIDRGLDSPEARRNRAAIWIGLGESERAIADLDRALEPASGTVVDRSERGATLRLRGMALHSLGRLRDAASDLNEAVRIDPRDAAALAARGHVFAEGRLYDQAAQDYLSAVHADPANAEAYRALAWVLATCPEARVRDPEAAVEAAYRARRLVGRDDFLTLDASAAASASAGDFAEAIRLQQRAIAVAPDGSADAAERLRLYEGGRAYVAGRGPELR